MKAIILPAKPDGFGAHLHESLWPLLGRPLIDVQLDALGEFGMREVWVILRYRPYGLDRHLQARMASSRALPLMTTVRLERSDRGLLGTLKRTSRFITETTLVLPADMVPPADLGACVTEHRANGVWLTEILDPSGSACFLLEPELLALLGDRGELFPDMLAGAGHAVRSRFHPGLARLGTPQGFLAAHAQLLTSRYVHPTARVHPAAKLAERVWIGPGCWVARDATISDGTVMLEGSKAERGARLEGVVVLPHVRVGKAARFRQSIVTSEGAFSEGGFTSEVDPDVLSSTRRNPRGESLHQGLDMALAAVALLLLAPLLLLVALIIRLDSPGPVFFSQLRVGQDRRGRLKGRVFELYKFRTMHVDADSRLAELKAQNAYGSGPFFKLENDPRITRVGNFLRKASLDELPQLLNVVLGDMRLVGNRPLPVYEAEALSEEWQRMRFTCPAGITGLWQISGRSDLSEHERMVLDTVYSVTRSFWSDWVILLKTLPALLLRRGAR